MKQKVMETREVVETCQTQPSLSSTSPLEAEKKEYKPPKKRKAKGKSKIVAKIAMNKKKSDEKKARLLSELETIDLHIKRINSNDCKK